jgi:hypothetical protein
LEIGWKLPFYGLFSNGKVLAWYEGIAVLVAELQFARMAAKIRIGTDGQ